MIGALERVRHPWLTADAQWDVRRLEADLRSRGLEGAPFDDWADVAARHEYPVVEGCAAATLLSDGDAGMVAPVVLDVSVCRVMADAPVPCDAFRATEQVMRMEEADGLDWLARRLAARLAERGWMRAGVRAMDDGLFAFAAVERPMIRRTSPDGRWTAAAPLSAVETRDWLEGRLDVRALAAARLDALDGERVWVSGADAYARL